MAKGIDVKIDNGRVAVVVGGQAEVAARNAAEATARRARDNIRGAGRIDTGAMIGGIVVEPAGSSALAPAFRVESTAPHSAYQEEGTRAHGPVRARHLVFRIRGSGPLIFAKWVRGVTGIHFMQRAFDSIRAGDFTK